MPDRQYSSRRAAVAAHQAILDSLSTIPGVTAVSASTCLPLTGACFGNSVITEWRLNDGRPLPVVWWRGVAAGYFEALGMRLLRGRSIDRGDVERGERIVVVDEAFANAFFPGRDPIGQRVQRFHAAQYHSAGVISFGVVQTFRFAGASCFPMFPQA